jgi:hypothetical protein
VSEHPKVTTSHLRRAAVIYVRQSTLAQVDRNRESTARQYDLVARAQALGWPRSAVRVIDEDLGQSGTSTAVAPDSPTWPSRSGWARSASWCRWKSPGWPATMLTGTGCWTWPG